MNEVPRDVAALASNVHKELFVRGALLSIVQDVAAQHSLLLSQVEQIQVLAAVVQLVHEPVTEPLRQRNRKLEEALNPLITAAEQVLDAVSGITDNLREDKDEEWVLKALRETDDAVEQLVAAIATARQSTG